MISTSNKSETRDEWYQFDRAVVILFQMSPSVKANKVLELSELAEEIQELCRASIKARESSYSPYSQFKVGAALKTSTGETITGCNVENASYGLAICAERTACVKAVSQVMTKHIFEKK